MSTIGISAVGRVVLGYVDEGRGEDCGVDRWDSPEALLSSKRSGRFRFELVESQVEYCKSVSQTLR